MSNALTHIDNKPSLRASHCEDEGRRNLKQSHPLVPALRFNEFEGEWNEITLRQLFTFKNGLNSDKEKYGSGVKFINVLDIIGNEAITYDSIIGKVEVTYKELEKNEVIYGDVLFQRSSETREEVGQANIYVDKINSAVFGGFVIRGRKKQDYDPYFINYLLKTSPARKEITTKSGGSTRYNVGQESLSQVFVNLTTLPEQQKIASFLSAVDEKIQQLTKKKALLEQYKKGVMQKLFSGQLRFKDEKGKDYPDWEEKKIGDITKVSTGGTPKTVKSEYWGGDIRWMNSGELNLKVVYEVENRITEEGLKKSATKLIPEKCILIGLAGQGKTRGTAAINMVELCTNQSIASILPNYDRFIPEYLFQNIDQRYSEIRGLSTGDGGRGGLNLQIIKSFKVPLPSVKEQEKIATYLSRIDTKIEAVNTQITQTQTFKKGLLQQMFV
jgi:type I restriction enzyme S subunit